MPGIENKRYIEELEARVKDLEKENMRLQTLLMGETVHKSEKEDESGALLFEKFKTNMIDKFIDADKM